MKYLIHRESILRNIKVSEKAIYKHKRTGDLFAIETNAQGKVVSTSGPLLVKDLNPNELDYDNYWDEDITVFE